MTVVKEAVVSIEQLKEFIEDENYLVVVDSCVLLDYYRYSSETAKAILSNLEYLTEKLWFPNQVYIEFKRNYELILGPNHNKYKNISNNISSNVKDFENKTNKLIKAYDKYNFPKVNELGDKIKQHLLNIEKDAKQYKEEIKSEMDLMSQLLRSNKMLEYIDSLKDNNQVGSPLSPKRILTIVNEGEKRFILNLPPGYKDMNKSEVVKENIKVEDPLAPYGDLIVWKSLIEKAKQDNVNIIFTTSDSKPDWWELDSSKNILAPREELLAEFEEETEGKVELLMLPMKEFVSNFSIISNTFSLYSEIELSTEELLADKLYESDEDIQQMLIEDATHVHLGNVEDIEDFQVINIALDNIETEIDEERVTITADFRIEAVGYFVEYISRDYSESTEVSVTLKGSYSILIELDVEKKSYSIDKCEITDLRIIDSIVHYPEDYEEIAPWDYCVVCSKRYGDHELYPDERICSSCSQNNDYILCTNCGTFYKHEDYTGDGQYCCGKCKD
ncbi:PIN-like domain-containing protein [Psychrobacillus psychrodurans]|uniref:PIN-like domain-containing protein n=1 Tax=Psychrobacillus psychrodurans TaxID=126157 RepID=A0A9X3R9E4_9BACI|nr:PIN-like domain-containing protein [Psychrobacillus psychrodurans]MCZ8533369.1 PIN-like domain-containing protein [Psychrobacillus psychrodurans]